MVAMSMVADLRSQTGQTEDRFSRLYVFREYPDAIQAVCKGDESPPTMSDPLSAGSTEEACAYLLKSPYDGFNPTTPQYEAGRRIEPPVSVPSALHGDISSTQQKLGTSFLLTRHIVQQRQQQRYHPNFLPQNGPRPH